MASFFDVNQRRYGPLENHFLSGPFCALWQVAFMTSLMFVGQLAEVIIGYTVAIVTTFADA